MVMGRWLAAASAGRLVGLLVLPCPCAASAALERTRGHHQPVLSRAPHHLVVEQTLSLNSASSCHLETFQQFVPSCQVAIDETSSSGT